MYTSMDLLYLLFGKWFCSPSIVRVEMVEVHLLLDEEYKVFTSCICLLRSVPNRHGVVSNRKPFWTGTLLRER